MWARSMMRSERSSMPQSQATAILPAAPSGRGRSFQPVPLQRGQFSRAMGTAYGCAGWTARCRLWENCGRVEAGEGRRRRKTEKKDGEERRRRKTEKKDGEERRRRAVILGRMTLHGAAGPRSGAHDGVG